PRPRRPSPSQTRSGDSPPQSRFSCPVPCSFRAHPLSTPLTLPTTRQTACRPPRLS
ncbi:hypothetical protein FBU31_002044, partial [Coemansia sp. 'formosensis']